MKRLATHKGKNEKICISEREEFHNGSGEGAGPKTF